MQVIGCQTNILWADKPANFAAVRKLLAPLNIVPPALVVLPEMFATGFGGNIEEAVEPEDGLTNRFLAQLAQELRSYVIGGVIGPGPDGRPQNQAAVFGPAGQPVARYAKLHPFTLAGEADQVSAGSDLVLFEIGDWIVAPTVCYDLRFPELYRRAVQKGAHLIVDIANWPVARIGHWVTLLKARAIENQAYVVGVNRTGRDPKFAYSGNSLILDPHGEVLAELGDQVGTLTADIELHEVLSWRQKFPVLADIRPELLGPLD